MSDASDDDRVGYGKPPKAHQFKKGVSGNPRGRPKRPASNQEILARINDERIPMIINGKRRLVKPIEAAARKTLQQCLQNGKPRDLEYLFKLLKEEGYDWRIDMREEATRGADEARATINRTIDRMFADDNEMQPLIEASEARECMIIEECYYCKPALDAERLHHRELVKSELHVTRLSAQIAQFESRTSKRAHGDQA